MVMAVRNWRQENNYWNYLKHCVSLHSSDWLPGFSLDIFRYSRCDELFSSSFLPDHSFLCILIDNKDPCSTSSQSLLVCPLGSSHVSPLPCFSHAGLIVLLTRSLEPRPDVGHSPASFPCETMSLSPIK